MYAYKLIMALIAYDNGIIGFPNMTAFFSPFSPLIFDTYSAAFPYLRKGGFCCVYLAYVSGGWFMASIVL